MTRQYIFRFVFSLAALAVLGAYIFGPEVLAKRFDTMALGLLGLAALPWLGALVEEFKIGGVEAKLRAIREEVAEAGDAASEAREVAEEIALNRHIPPDFDDLLTREFGGKPAQASPSPKAQKSQFTLEKGPIKPSAGLSDTDLKDRSDYFGDDPFALDNQDTRQDIPSSSEPAKPVPLDLLAPLEKMASTYVETRKAMPSSAARTAKMTAIFGDMQNTAARLGGDNSEILQWLRGDDAGQQLAGLAWLRNFPAAVPPSSYIDVIERSTQPFVQYWALRALSGRLSALGLDEFSIADRVALKEFESLMRAGTDRHAQIRRINRKLSGRTPL